MTLEIYQSFMKLEASLINTPLQRGDSMAAGTRNRFSGFHTLSRATRSSRNRSSAFTLIEIMVVVVIIGILAAAIIPKFIGTTHDAKVGAAKSHIAELANALERFNVHMDRYPATEEGLQVLVEAPADDANKKWRGPYIDQLRADPWQTPYQYLFPGTRHTTSYDLWSRGADGQDGGEGQNADIGNWQ